MENKSSHWFDQIARRSYENIRIYSWSTMVWEEDQALLPWLLQSAHHPDCIPFLILLCSACQYCLSWFTRIGWKTMQWDTELVTDRKYSEHLLHVLWPKIIPPQDTFIQQNPWQDIYPVILFFSFLFFSIFYLFFFFFTSKSFSISLSFLPTNLNSSLHKPTTPEIAIKVAMRGCISCMDYVTHHC